MEFEVLIIPEMAFTHRNAAKSSGSGHKLLTSKCMFIGETWIYVSMTFDAAILTEKLKVIT